jgi:hypothetical protein
MLEDAQSLWLELRGLTHDRFRLAALETQRAGKSLVDMIAAGVIVAVLLIGSWLGFLAAAMLGLVAHGMVASSAILLAIVFNLLLTLILLRVIRHKSRYLQFPATLRSLQPMPSGRRDTVPSKANQIQVSEGSNRGCGAKAIEPSTEDRCSHRYAGPEDPTTDDRSGHFAAGGRHRIHPWGTHPVPNRQTPWRT